MMERAEGEVAIDIGEAVLSSTRQKLDALSEEPMASANFTFFHAPAHVRQRNKHLYEPQTVAIGPYYRRNKPSLRAMEQLKWRYLQDFLSRNPSNCIAGYIAEVRELEPAARRCYFEPVELSPVEFVEMLLLDGCFILEFIIKWSLMNEDAMCTPEWKLPLIRGDLLLLENQIPLFVLDKLFELVESTLDSKIPSTLMELLVKYLTRINVESTNEIESLNHYPSFKVPGEAIDFQHLLHLYYHCYVTEPQTDPTGSTICGTILKWLRPSRIFALLLSCIRLKICRLHKKRLPRTIPSATELLEAGVTIKKKKTNQNQNQKRLSSFLNVTFHDGVLEIPFLSVENSTLPRFSNLVAFEQCGGCEPDKAYMTSYATFMDCLIDMPRDAVILHQRGILENNLASDKELVVFFNELSNSAAMDYEKHYLAGLFREVGEYCDNDWPKWRAKMVRAYFSNSWAILSLAAAVLALVLTFLQTLYTIYPSHYPGN